SVAGLVDEIVVIDTGSTDATRAVAARFGARVIGCPWADSFAAARNASIEHARGDWIFWMDADDRLDEPNRDKLRALVAGLGTEEAAYVMKCRCPSAEGRAAVLVDHVRLFRNLPSLRWRYRVHEQVLPALRELGHELRWSDVEVLHTGYLDPAVRRAKLARDERLLALDLTERPDDPFVLFNLGTVALEAGRTGEALRFFQRTLERSAPHHSIVHKLYALVATCHRRLGRPAEALAVVRAGRLHHADDPELLWLEGALCRDLGRPVEARAC